MDFLSAIRAGIILTGTVGILWVSRASLRSPGTHGFYRFLAWESMLMLFAAVVPRWFDDPFSWHQLVSWFLLLASIYPILAGVRDLRRFGRATEQRDDENLFGFEKTTRLVSEGIYAHIRHPLYSSLLLLTWGMCLKQPALVTVLLAALASVFLWATSRADEEECLRYFGEAYAKYMQGTKRFVPRLF